MIKKSDFTLNEKDSLQDMIDVEKQIMGIYGLAMAESSTKNIRSLFKANLIETSEDQYGVFKTMQDNDYYCPKPASKVDLDEQANNFKQIKKQLAK